MGVYECVIGCTRVFVYQRVGLVACCSDLDSIVRSEPVTGDSDSCSQKTRYTGDSKTDSWDDSKIHTSSCSEYQTAIRFSCECLFLSIFLFTIVSRHLYITCIISCNRLIYFTILITCITSCDISECLRYLFS